MRVIAIYPGRFHPWHKGHKQVYDWLVSKFGKSNVFITTTDVTDNIKSPFSFEEKKKMMSLTGVSVDKIIQVKNNYNLSSVSEKVSMDVNSDIILFAVSKKDMDAEPRFKSFVKKDGSPSYLQLFPKSNDDLQPAIKHGYIISVPVNTFKVMGKNVTSATQLREMFISLNDPQKQKYIIDLFGKFDQSILNIFNSKLTPKLETLNEDVDSDISSLVKKRDVLDYQIEVLRLKKAISALERSKENVKQIDAEGGDSSVARTQIKNVELDVRSAKKRVAAANVKKSA
jgi:hypothetical protein